MTGQVSQYSLLDCLLCSVHTEPQEPALAVGDPTDDQGNYENKGREPAHIVPQVTLTLDLLCCE